MTREEKQVAILPWWQNLHQTLLTQRISQQKLRDAVIGSTFYFRHGFAEFLKMIHQNELKLHISSAGVMGIISQSIEMLVQAACPVHTHEKTSKNIVYCGTKEDYDKDGVLVEFKEPIITSLNKSTIITHEKMPHIARGSNAIILGDLLPDLFITENLQLDTVLTIGYYHEGASLPLEKYMAGYDAVITGDGNLTWVTNLIKSLCTH